MTTTRGSSVQTINASEHRSSTVGRVLRANIDLDSGTVICVNIIVEK